MTSKVNTTFCMYLIWQEDSDRAMVLPILEFFLSSQDCAYLYEWDFKYSLNFLTLPPGLI